MLAVGIIVSGLVIYTAVRAAILHSFAVMEREKAEAAKRLTKRMELDAEKKARQPSHP